MTRLQIIAEIGVNHDGDVQIAKRMIDYLSPLDINFIKFQTFNAKKLVSTNARKANYQMKMSDGSSTQFEMLKKLELSSADYQDLKEYCDSKGLTFLSTPFDIDALQFLQSIGCPFVKVPSGEIANVDFLNFIGRSNLGIVMSTGMARLSDIEWAVANLFYGYTAKQRPLSSKKVWDLWSQESDKQEFLGKLTILQCETEYPAKIDNANLLAMQNIGAIFGCRYGFSDHTTGSVASIVAVARGASVIEKHVTYDKKAFGPDHSASLDLVEFAKFVDELRMAERSLGVGMKLRSTTEIENAEQILKRCIAKREIRKGQKITADDVIMLRHSEGILASKYWDLLGSEATNNMEVGDPFIMKK